MRFSHLVLAVAAMGLWSATSAAQVGDANEWFIGTVAFPNLSANPNLQKELRLNEEQKGTISVLQKEATDQGLALAKARFNRKGTPEEPPGDEQRTREKSRNVTIELQNKLTSVLDKDQLRRLGQIQIQNAGAPAFLSPKIQKALGFGDEQKKKAQEIVADMSKSMQLMAANDKGIGAAELRRRTLEIHLQAFERAHGMLNDKQKAEWQLLNGKAFTKPFELGGN